MYHDHISDFQKTHRSRGPSSTLYRSNIIMYTDSLCLVTTLTIVTKEVRPTSRDFVPSLRFKFILNQRHETYVRLSFCNIVMSLNVPLFHLEVKGQKSVHIFWFKMERGIPWIYVYLFV